MISKLDSLDNQEYTGQICLLCIKLNVHGNTWNKQEIIVGCKYFIIIQNSKASSVN